jgi:hypothetical protein
MSPCYGSTSELAATPRAIVVLGYDLVYRPQTVAGRLGLPNRSGRQLHLDTPFRRSRRVHRRSERQRGRYRHHYEKYGLDRPLVVQFLDWAGHATEGNLGRSFLYHVPVWGLIRDRLPVTLTLGLTGLSIALLVALPLGILAAVREGSAMDRGIMMVALLGQAMPGFWFGLVMIVLLGLELQWLPISGVERNRSACHHPGCGPCRHGGLCQAMAPIYPWSTAASNRFRKPSTASGSIQRTTATRSCS